MGATQLPTEIPPSLYRFFWDVQAETVSPSAHPYYVINRLLDKGDLAAVKWIIRSISRNAIIDSLKYGPPVDPPTAVFWSNYLKISRKEIATNRYYRKRPDPRLWPFGNLN